MRGRSIIIAGVQYRKLDLPKLEQFEGIGVYYGAIQIEAHVCRGEDVAVVGGGNSAGQAALFLSQSARHVYLLVRGPGLADSMSRYLISRIEASREITLKASTQIEALQGASHLDGVRWRNQRTGEAEFREIRDVFLMTGANPNTGLAAGLLGAGH